LKSDHLLVTNQLQIKTSNYPQNPNWSTTGIWISRRGYALWIGRWTHSWHRACTISSSYGTRTFLLWPFSVEL